ncbi:hypothetical protein ElyMa_002197600 [Elysia marginata]|uniref:EF-hand domain-containing protein n=1 Tax=Elysia marginata TaxID=1093978 RepID=A0AAV4FR78_9GAST|nr:hypothetical protein ElyMa_002197600 [Elysia marginata]
MSKRSGPLRSLNSGRDEYETRLKELFDESDESDKGHLNTIEVQALCSRLQLGRLRDRLVRSLGERCVDKDKLVFSSAIYNSVNGIDLKMAPPIAKWSKLEVRAVACELMSSPKSKEE